MLVSRRSRGFAGRACRDRPAWFARRCVKVFQAPKSSVTSSSDDEDRELVSKLPTSLLVSQLKAMGQDCRYVFEKSELVNLLVAAREEARSRVVRLPLRRAKATEQSPKEFIIVPVDVGDEGFMDFALDTGASGALITPQARDRIGATPSQGTAVKGVSSGGMTVRQLLPLPPLRLGGRELALSHAVVTDLLSPNLEGVDGMLGMEFLQQFDIEVDFEHNTIAFYPPGSAATGGILNTQDMYSFSCTPVLGSLMTVLVSLNDSARFRAVIDMATSFSIINSQAVLLSKLDAVLPTNLMTAVGRSAESAEGVLPLFRPAAPLLLTLGDADKGDVPLTTTVQSLLVGDLAAFEVLKMNDGPAMLLAMDVLKQRRLVLSFACNKLYLQT